MDFESVKQKNIEQYPDEWFWQWLQGQVTTEMEEGQLNLEELYDFFELNVYNDDLIEWMSTIPGYNLPLEQIEDYFDALEPEEKHKLYLSYRAEQVPLRTGTMAVEQTGPLGERATQANVTWMQNEDSGTVFPILPVSQLNPATIRAIAERELGEDEKRAWAQAGFDLDTPEGIQTLVKNSAYYSLLQNAGEFGVPPDQLTAQLNPPLMDIAKRLSEGETIDWDAERETMQTLIESEPRTAEQIYDEGKPGAEGPTVYRGQRPIKGELTGGESAYAGVRGYQPESGYQRRPFDYMYDAVIAESAEAARAYGATHYIPTETFEANRGVYDKVFQDVVTRRTFEAKGTPTEGGRWDRVKRKIEEEAHEAALRALVQEVGSERAGFDLAAPGRQIVSPEELQEKRKKRRMAERRKEPGQTWLMRGAKVGGAKGETYKKLGLGIQAGAKASAKHTAMLESQNVSDTDWLKLQERANKVLKL